MKPTINNAANWHHESVTTPLPEDSLAEAIQSVMEGKVNPWKKYLSNEDNNYHSENVLHLAKHVGDADDVAKATAILARHKKEGHLSDENGDDRYALHKKLYPKFVAAFAPK